MIVLNYRKETRQRPKPGDNPLVVFSEWKSEADEKAYRGTITKKTN